MRKRMFLPILILMLLFGCSSDNTVNIKPMKVTVNITVYHGSTGSDIPTSNAYVNILNLEGKPVDPEIFLSAETDGEGKAVIISNHEILHPKNSYYARASYPASKDVDKLFTIPQHPNGYNEYFVNVEINHKLGDDPNYISDVKINAHVSEQIAGMDSVQNAVNVLLELYNTDGTTTPAPNNFVYQFYTDSEGNGIKQISSDYFLPGETYAIKAMKYGFVTELVEFTVPDDITNDYYQVYIEITLIIN